MFHRCSFVAGPAKSDSRALVGAESAFSAMVGLTGGRALRPRGVGLILPVAPKAGKPLGPAKALGFQV